MPKEVMTQELAGTCVSLARQKAKELSIAVSIAVTDSHGYLVWLERMDGAGFLTPEIAAAKAYAAAAFGTTGTQLRERFKDRPEFVAGLAAMSGRIIIGPGSAPIVRDGAVVGAIGISGASPEQDQVCADTAARP